MKKLLLIVGFCLILSNFSYAVSTLNLSHNYWLENTSVIDEFGGLGQTNGDSIAGYIGNGIDLAGVDSPSDTLNLSEIGVGTGNFTIGFWIKVNAAKEQALFNSFPFNPVITSTTGGSTTFRIWDSVESTYCDAGGLGTGTWRYLILRRNGTGNNQYAGFMDGVFGCSIVNVGDYTAGKKFSFGAYAAVGQASRWLDATIDEVTIWKRALSNQEITDLYTNYTLGIRPEGNGTSGGGGIPGVNQTYLVTLFEPSPLNNSIKNIKNFTYYWNMTGNPNPSLGKQFSVYYSNNSILKQFGYNGVFTGNILVANISPYLSVGDTYRINISNTDAGQYYSNFSYIMYFTYDPTAPSITLNPTNSFNTNNVTANIYTNLTLNFTIGDARDLYLFSVNVTRNGVSYFNFTSANLSGLTTYQYNITRDVTSWGVGYYNVTILASDTHTVTAIDDYLVTPKEKFLIFDKAGLDFKTAEGNDISIETDGEAITSAIKQTDRYNFNFDFNDEQIKDRIFYVKSENKIEYMPRSGYKAHFVIWNDKTKQGNWVDFEGVEGKPTINKVSDYEYTVTFPSLSDKITFESIGGLNVNTVHYQWLRSTLNISSVILTPSIPITSDTLEGKAIANEGLGNNISFKYIWFKNGAIYLNNTYIYDQYFIQGILYGIANLSSNYTEIGDNITFSVATYSNGTYSGYINSSMVTISSVGIDNCTSFNITSLNVFFKDLSNIPVNVNISQSNFYKLDTLSNNFSNSMMGSSNFTYCINPNGRNFQSNISIQYIYSSNVFNYFLENTILNDTARNITIYVDSGTSVLATVFDNQNNRVEDVYITILKKDLSTGNFISVGQVATNFEGEAQMYLTLNSVYYKFMLYYPISTLRSTTTETYIYANTIEFQIDIFPSMLDEYYELDGISDTFTYDNDTRIFTYTYGDPSGSVTSACIYVYTVKASGMNQYNNTCLTSSSGSIMTGITFQNNTQYIAKAYVYKGTDEFLRSSLSVFFSGEDTLSFDSLFGLFIMTILFAFITFFSIPIAIIMIPLPTVYFAIAGLIPIAPAIAIGMEIAALILAIYIGKRG